LKVSAAGLRIINRIGLDAAIKKAIDKGYLDINTLNRQVIA
jgi:large subunit ribosomal protein L28